MTDKTIDLDHSSRNGGSEIHGSPSTVGVAPARKKGLAASAGRIEDADGRGSGGELARSCPRGALLFNASLAAQDPWRQKLIATVFDDFEPFDRKPSG
jgi:hypothetical protein